MNIAFITNPSVQCGVAQYGLDIVAALQGFSRHTVTSYPLADRHDFEAARADIAAADLALYNITQLRSAFSPRPTFTAWETRLSAFCTNLTTAPPTPRWLIIFVTA